MMYCLSLAVVLLAIGIATIHISPPFLSYQCVLFGRDCPEVRSQTVTESSAFEFDSIGKSIEHWVENGEEIAAQINIRMADKEIYNFFGADGVRTEQIFDEKSLGSIWSNTKLFAALFIGVAVDEGWIESLDDPVTKYWPQFPTNNGRYNIKISDVLKHESGLCVYEKYKVAHSFNNINVATYDILKRAIEDEKIRFFGHSDFTRCYHTISYGHILNELFHAVEPQKRWMAQYYEEEMLPSLVAEDPAFGLTFRGLRYVGQFGNPFVYNLERSFDVEIPSFLWRLYHETLPKYVLRRPINSDQSIKASMCKYLQPTDLCPTQDVHMNNSLFLASLDTVWEMYNSHDYSPKRLSSFNRDPLIEHMSYSGLGNAHSIAKTFEYIWKSISADTRQLMLSDPDTKFDIALGIDTAFTVGGFGKITIDDVEWYGWNGWGGSTLMYAPKYDCVVSYVVVGFNRPFYAMDPRKSVVLNLLSQQLK